MKKETLCWSCDNRNCSWHQRFEPVKGWVARKDYIAVDETTTFCVQDCPQYHLWDRYFLWLLAATVDNVYRANLRLDDSIMSNISVSNAVLIRMRLANSTMSDMAEHYGKTNHQMTKMLQKAGKEYLEARDKEETEQ